MTGEWSENRCLDGGLVVRGELDSRKTLAVVRNTGGGSSICCHYYPVAAPARVVGDRSIELRLLPRTNFHDMHKPIRNGARVFLADQCTELRYVREWYSGIGLAQLLGKTVSVTVDLSAAACGCAAAFTLVPMRQNSESGACDGDYYCDPTSTCGVSCAEIALFEANRHAFKVRVHNAVGPTGLENGLGGHHSAFTANEYGPGGTLIDTLKRFRVNAFFVAGADNELVDIQMNLEQAGRSLSFSLVEPSSHHADASASRWYLGSVVATLGGAGLTPVLSYRSARSMETLDAPPCVYDHMSAKGDEQDSCGEIVHFDDLVMPFEAPRPPPASPPPVDPPPVRQVPHKISAGLNAREQAWGGMRLVGKDDQALPMATAVDAPEREAADHVDPASCGGVEMPRAARVASES